jgi:hypothetical protein
MYSRPKRCVVFGMTTAGRAVMVAPPIEKMKPIDTGMYVHADSYDQSTELVERIEQLCQKQLPDHPLAKTILFQINAFKKELEDV